MIREIFCVLAVLYSVNAYSKQDFHKVVYAPYHQIPPFVKSGYQSQYGYGQKTCVEEFLKTEKKLMGELVYKYEAFAETGFSSPLNDVLFDAKSEAITEMTDLLVANWAHLGQAEKEYIRWSLEQIVYIHSYNVALGDQGVLGIHMEVAEFGQSPPIRGSCESEDLAFLLNYYRTAMNVLPRMYYAYDAILYPRWLRTLPKEELYRADSIDKFAYGTYEGRELIILQGVIDVASGADVGQVSHRVRQIIGTNEEFLQNHEINLLIVKDILSAPILPSPVPLPEVPGEDSSMSSIYSAQYTSPHGFHRGYVRNTQGQWLKTYGGSFPRSNYEVATTYPKPALYSRPSSYSKPSSYSSSYSKHPEPTDCTAAAEALKLQGQALIRYRSELLVYAERTGDFLKAKTARKIVKLVEKQTALVEYLLAYPNLPVDKNTFLWIQLDYVKQYMPLATMTLENIAYDKSNVVPNFAFSSPRNICPEEDLGLKLSNFGEFQSVSRLTVALAGIYQRILEYYPRDVADFLNDQADKALNILVLDRTAAVYDNILAVLNDEISVLLGDAKAQELGIDEFRKQNKIVADYFAFLNNGEAPPTEPLGVEKSSRPSTYNPYESMTKPSYGSKPSYVSKPSYGSKPSYVTKPSYVSKPYKPKPKPYSSKPSAPEPYSLFTPTTV